MGKQATAVLNRTFTADGAVAAHRAVGWDGAQVDAEGAKVAGIALAAAGDGELFAATIIGSATAETGDAIAVGDSLVSDAEGRVIPADPLAIATGTVGVTSTIANGEAVFLGGDLPVHVFADAAESASGAGAFIEIVLRR